MLSVISLRERTAAVAKFIRQFADLPCGSSFMAPVIDDKAGRGNPAGKGHWRLIVAAERLGPIRLARLPIAALDRLV
jgi:hypothetical protein